MAQVYPSGAPGLADGVLMREKVFNATFGGTIVNLGCSKEAYKADNGVQGDTECFMFDPLGMITCKRACCTACCGKSCPLRYASTTNSGKGYEYSIQSSCCGAKWMEARKGSSAEEESGGAKVEYLAYTHVHKPGCGKPPETWGVGDMVPDGSGGFKKGPIKYGLRNKASLCKVGLLGGCFAQEKESCNQLMDGNLIMITMMPIYHNAAGYDPNAGGPIHDDTRNDVIGTVSMQNILVPTCCCCAVPGGCPLNVKVDIDEKYAHTMSDDEKYKLGLFAMTPNLAIPPPPGGVPLFPQVLPMPFHWFGVQLLMKIGYTFGIGMTNTEARYAGLKEAFGEGMADTGDLLPKIQDTVTKGIAAAKAAAAPHIAAAKQAAEEGMEKAKDMAADAQAQAEAATKSE